MAETIKGQASPKIHFFHITPPTQRSSQWRVKEVREKDAQVFDTYKEGKGILWFMMNMDILTSMKNKKGSG